MLNLWPLNTKKTTLLDDLKVPKPHFYNGPWIMGGAAIKFYETGDFKDCKDIDYFFKTNGQYIKFKNKFKKVKNISCHSISQNNYGVAENFNFTIDNVTFNLIGFNFGKDPTQIANTFDFSVCQIWTDGYITGCSKITEEHINNKVLSLTGQPPTKVEERIKTYRDKGYKPDKDMIEYILKVEERIKIYRDKGYKPDKDMIEYILKNL